MVYNFKIKSFMLNKFDHDHPHWLFGHLLQLPKVFNDAGLRYKRERTARYRDFCLSWIGPLLPVVAITSPIGARALLKTAEPKGNMYQMLKPWLGEGLLLSSGEKWARNRRLLTPAFHFEILKPYLVIKNRAADVFCKKFEKYAVSGDFFDVCSVVTMFTLDVILQCSFSYETNCQDQGSGHPYVKAVNELGRLLSKRVMNPLLHSDLIYYLTQDGRQFRKHCIYVHSITEDIILSRRAALKKNNATSERKISSRRGCQDFLDILLMAKDEHDIGLRDKEIRDEVDTFLFEGHDTTASAISWTLYSIAQHGIVQCRLQKEIDSLLYNRKTDDLLASDLNQLMYLSMCIKESLRLHCVVSAIMRQVTRDFTVDNGKTIPENTLTSILIYCIHHNPHIWEDSLEFRPERFSPENIDKIPTFSYIPFSAGPRNCIGQNFALHEIKVILVKVLHRFFLELDPSHKPGKLESMVMRAENGIKIKVTQRGKGQYMFEE
ncbi:hypothetical protein LOTGIDRAFT_154296 [Lottia gigantea]|uniref:Uncharacterized protein n=1 Tax=Lottia gigantea TaxID=225164 RepID=V4A7C9_LOTGI|nr:hypothetical protein LOTGIDRAFT_154296 [Lottia gigantea]ESO89206.1 hypothetical protein LOTGIDRAFT_154296 [Lottia gigantea]